MRLVNVAPGYIITLLNEQAEISSYEEFEFFFDELQGIVLLNIDHAYFSTDRLTLL